MNQEHHRWFSHRLSREMGIRVHGHYGQPILVFPTSGGDEWEYEGQGMIAALGHHIDGGRVKFFCVTPVRPAQLTQKNFTRPASMWWLQGRDHALTLVFPLVAPGRREDKDRLAVVPVDAGDTHLPCPTRWENQW